MMLMRRRNVSVTLHSINRIYYGQPLKLGSYTLAGRHFTSTSIHGKSDDSSLHNSKNVDVAIVGGGAVGSLMAKLLSEKVPSLKVALLDFRTPRLGKDVLPTTNPTLSEPNARAYALSPASLNLFGENVLRRLVDSGRVAFYDSMQIWESDGPATLHFTQEDIESQGIEGGLVESNVLGAVIEDEPLISCIWDDLREKGQVDLLSPSSVKSISSSCNPIKSQQPGYSDPVELTYLANDGKEEHKLTADLLIAADGANSIVRRLLGTFPTISIGYGRKAVTCTVALERDINRTAFQRFQPNGPIALLPVWGDDNSNKQNGMKYYANIVWSTTPSEAEELQQLSNEEFINRMNELLQSGPTNTPPLFSEDIKNSSFWPISQAAQGLEMLSQSINTGLSMSSWTERQRGFVVPPVITEIVGKRFGFPLNLMHAKNYVGNRVCLIGDAAHTIHPMAGQGLNLGMADAECLAGHIQRSIQSGMGIKDNAGLQYALQQYESERQREVVSVMGGIQILHAAFGTTFSPAVHVRSVGMNIVNSIGPVRRKLVRVATGVDGIFEKK